jgi:hypothetical protein
VRNKGGQKPAPLVPDESWHGRPLGEAPTVAARSRLTSEKVSRVAALAMNHGKRSILSDIAGDTTSQQLTLRSVVLNDGDPEVLRDAVGAAAPGSGRTQSASRDDCGDGSAAHLIGKAIITATLSIRNDCRSLYSMGFLLKSNRSMRVTMNHIRNILELSMMPLSSGVYNVYWIFPQLYTIHTGCLTVRSGAGLPP